MRASAGLFVLILAAEMPVARGADAVTIYRCTDAAGHLTLRDTPCAKGQAQQTRTMLRPRDATTPPVRPTPVREADAAPDVVTRTVVVRPPRPLYECVPPDGEPYTSDTPEGHPRWVPLWTLGIPIARHAHGHGLSGTQLAITHGSVHIDGGTPMLRPPIAVSPWAYGAGTWIRDDCRALPQQEVCARLADRRDAIGRRFFNAMPSERDTLRVEERGINARLDDDCGGH